MRIKNEIRDINYENTREFFRRRAQKYNTENPYSVTMYQDNDAELVRLRNSYETEKISRMLDLNDNCDVLELACGVGRWADALNDKIGSYTGIDFSEELIMIARKRNTRTNVKFITASMTNLDAVLEAGRTYNRILIIGALVYLNDNDIYATMEQVEKHCRPNTIICIREPIGIETRLTLKDFYSEELKDNYNAIYRTRDEIIHLITPSILEKGFAIHREGFLFDNARMNNRTETAQYYFILERKG